MSAIGRAVRIVSGPRYRLVATFAGGAEECSRDEFDSIPAAQGGVGEFVYAIAERGRPTSVRVERIVQAAAGKNGKARHEAPAAGETLRHWDESVIERILRQRAGRAAAAESPPTSANGAPSTVTAPSESLWSIGAAETRSDWAPAAPTTPAAAEPSEVLTGVVEGRESVEWEAPAPVGEEPTAAPVMADPQASPISAEFIAITESAELSTEKPATDESPPAEPGVVRSVAEPEPIAPTIAAEHRYSAYRPHHRRTRWALILTAAFVAIVVGGMILLETNGDPIGYLRKLSSGEKVRETLPFRNGDGAATKPAGRK